jgi:hypothetical protein
LNDCVRIASGSAFKWWALNAPKYLKVAKVAKKFLCAPRTEVDRERLFSKARRVYTPERNRLLGDNADELLDFKY